MMELYLPILKGLRSSFTVISSDEFCPPFAPTALFGRKKYIYTLKITLFAPFSPGCQAQPLDLVFAVDASAGVGLENFLQLRDFVKSSSSHFSINRDVTQIALVAYGSKAHTVFALDTHTSNSALLQAVDQAPFLGDVPSAGSALRHIYGDVMTVQKGARPGVNKVVVVLTNGGGTEGAAAPAQQLRDNGVLVFVVVIGDARRDALLRVAGSPTYLVPISSYEALRHYQDLITERICEGENIPTSLFVLLAGGKLHKTGIEGSFIRSPCCCGFSDALMSALGVVTCTLQTGRP